MNVRSLIKILLIFQLSCFAQDTDEVKFYPTFYEWANACNQLAYYKDVDYLWETPLTYENLQIVLAEFNDMMSKSSFVDSDTWINISNNPNTLSNYFLIEAPFQPFVQKACLTTNSKIAFKGDLHGDIHSLIQFIEELTKLGYMDFIDPFFIQDPNFCIVFLGDYTDKGVYGSEVLYTLLRLKIANPSQVFLLRGNHEDMRLNINDGFAKELVEKFSIDNDTDPYCADLAQNIANMYNLLPVCLFLGITGEYYTHYLQCCHGGMEIGHSPAQLLDSPTIQFELLTTLNRADISKEFPSLSNSPIILSNIALSEDTGCSSIGYMWSDFSQNGNLQNSSRGNGIYVYGKKVTEEILHQSRGPNHHICGIFRAHQHANCWTEMMQLLLDRRVCHPKDKGCAKLWRTGIGGNFWDGIVCTLMVSPDNSLGKPNAEFPGNSVDYWALLTTDIDFDEWELSIHSNHIYAT